MTRYMPRVRADSGQVTRRSLNMIWLLLIYTVPRDPSRKRAAIWRDIKKLGAVYLHDGVCALPEQEEALAAFRRVADKVIEFGGQATVARSVELDESSERKLVAAGEAERAEEYSDIRQEVDAFLAHLHRERRHREFTFAELEEIEEDLGKLKRWFSQIESRDFVRAPTAEEIRALIAVCASEVDAFLEEASEHEEVLR